jgi:hypothetical protein
MRIRAASFYASDLTRAVKATVAAGLDVRQHSAGTCILRRNRKHWPDPSALAYEHLVAVTALDGFQGQPHCRRVLR